MVRGSVRRGGVRPLVACAAALLLPGCTAGPDPEPPARARPRPAAAAATPAGPVTRFDGRYAGPLALLPDRTRRCPEAPLIEREITVRNGRASFMINPQVQQVLTGTVGADGSARIADSLDRNIATSGVFNEDGFLGEHRNGLCAYSVRMTKRG
jgi:hypothetical protein